MPSLKYAILFAALFAAPNLVAAEIEQKSFIVSVPLSIIGNEAGGRLEYNLGAEAGLALDLIYAAPAEEYSEERVQEENTSLRTKGYEAALTISRFTRPLTMAGFYWSVGAGYRHLDAELHRQYDESYTLVGNEEFDEEGRVTHKLEASGITGRARIGYRYVAPSIPFMIGGYFGLRHFENKFVDKNNKENSPISDNEREGLKRIVMTRPEGGLEIGISF